MKENILIIPLSGGGKAVVNLNYVVGAYPIAEGVTNILTTAYVNEQQVSFLTTLTPDEVYDKIVTKP
jgi:hypothetical protein|nr:MAG TPA: hypothetical protein [Caudoviricetes sp.]